MLRRTLSSFCLSNVFFAGSASAQTSPDQNVTAVSNSESIQLSDPAAIRTTANDSDFISINSTATDSFEPAPFLDAYELGFIENDDGTQKQEFTQDELAKIKESFDVPKTTDDPRYKPVFNIRAGEEKPEWQRGDYYPAGR